MMCERGRAGRRVYGRNKQREDVHRQMETGSEDIGLSP
jgi:hypothetical protein